MQAASLLCLGTVSAVVRREYKLRLRRKMNQPVQIIWDQTEEQLLDIRTMK
jgi:hypothetical protein